MPLPATGDDHMLCVEDGQERFTVIDRRNLSRVVERPTAKRDIWSRILLGREVLDAPGDKLLQKG
jgi:hypothetical protein